jgi:succinate dehydrogenase/fumarate reductase cytochrome b subunit
MTQLLGKRTGNLMSFILRSVFFIVILFWTLHALITVRLLIVDNVNNSA